MIKIENPVSGDDTRGWGPPFANPLPEFKSETYRGESAYFLCVLLLASFSSQLTLSLLDSVISSLLLLGLIVS